MFTKWWVTRLVLVLLLGLFVSKRNRKFVLTTVQWKAIKIDTKCSSHSLNEFTLNNLKQIPKECCSFSDKQIKTFISRKQKQSNLFINFLGLVKFWKPQRYPQKEKEKIPQYRRRTDRAEIINGILCRCQHTNNTCCEGTRAKSLSAFAFYFSFSPQQSFVPLRRTDKVLWHVLHVA